MRQMDSFKYLEDILLGPMRGRALFLAIKLQIFELLQTGPLPMAKIMHHLQIENKRSFEKLLNVLQSLGLICFDGESYCNTKITQELFSADQKNNFADFFCFLTEAVESRSLADLFCQIKENKPLEIAPGSFAQWQLYMRAMHELGMLSADVIAQTANLKNVKTLCDVGSGPGTYAQAFAQAYPDLQVTLFDVEPSLNIARENLTKSAFGDQFQFVQGSVLDETFGGPYEVIFLSHVIHLFNQAQILQIFQTARRSLAPQGKLWIRDLFLNSEKTSPELGAFLSLCVWTEGGAYSQKEVGYFLEQAGFTSVKYVELGSENQFPQVIGNLIEASNG